MATPTGGRACSSALPCRLAPSPDKRADMHASEAAHRSRGMHAARVRQTGAAAAPQLIPHAACPNPAGEVPGNGLDDDGNGLVDDVFGYDFVKNVGSMTVTATADYDHGTRVAGGAACCCSCSALLQHLQPVQPALHHSTSHLTVELLGRALVARGCQHWVCHAAIPGWGHGPTRCCCWQG